ncbi:MULTISPECIES: hypothetical protein [unclassified Streptomyces]|uniref:hypothetical protein n=1 Tax=unclassified Streptomyces TaxID=2593676 RepID=UPI002E807502|nr:hypothetical protein [Streptomyces sp. NBC_00589]WTI36295.1 hypothetical protein OIC96_15420 [Streptomyces sp. NBC_00775]WUB30030.1 hypothetical protein OHA51_34310 [Streptomyces sp. NBC_00589]
MDEEVRIEVGRDMAGQIAVGRHLIQLSGAHSSVTLIQREQLPRPVPREDMTLLPRPAEELGELLDAAPAATYLVACTDRTLWGEGTAKRLRGLGPADSVELLERALDRDLDTAELRTARTLRQLTEGTPLRLLNAAAAVHRAGGPPR